MFLFSSFVLSVCMFSSFVLDVFMYLCVSLFLDCVIDLFRDLFIYDLLIYYFSIC